MKKSRRHALGQHFLHNPGILDKIIAVISPDISETIIEIGAGKGSLTKRLAARSARVITVERDSRLIQHLRQRLPVNVELIESDVLQMDFESLPLSFPVKLTGNLPYSISSPLLFKFLDYKHLFSAIMILLQKEVAERLSAQPGSKQYSPLSILIQNSFDPSIEFSIPAGSFSPPPKVESALVRLTPRKTPQFVVGDEIRFKSFLFHIFRQRRKKIRNCLRGFPYPDAGIDQSLNAAEIDGELRPEQVSAASLAALFTLLSEKHTSPPKS